MNPAHNSPEGMIQASGGSKKGDMLGRPTQRTRSSTESAARIVAGGPASPPKGPRSRLLESAKLDHDISAAYRDTAQPGAVESQFPEDSIDTYAGVSWT
jgi:hypothetical protein